GLERVLGDQLELVDEQDPASVAGCRDQPAGEAEVLERQVLLADPLQPIGRRLALVAQPAAKLTHVDRIAAPERDDAIAGLLVTATLEDEQRGREARAESARRLARPVHQLMVRLAAEVELEGQLGEGIPTLLWHRRRLDRRPVQLVRVVERRLLADDDLAAHEAGLKRDVLQRFEQVRLTGAEIAGDEQARRLRALRDVVGNPFEQSPEACLDPRLPAAKRQDGITIRHTGSQGLDGATCLKSIEGGSPVEPGPIPLVGASRLTAGGWASGAWLASGLDGS